MTRETALELLETPAAREHLSDSAVENLREWLTEPQYEAYLPLVEEHVREGKWQALDDVFWTVIPFGTGGRRGRMYPIGCNAINDRTMGESAQGLAEYVSGCGELRGTPACAIAYDTRHNSRHFAELCAEVMVAAGFQVYFLDGYRSTPELSVAVRHKRCACGIMITASHNPPADNAIKAYWSHGGQLLPPHDKGVIECVGNVGLIHRVPFAEAVADGRIAFCQDEVDRAYVDAVVVQSSGGPRDLKILYSPMHGVGASAVCPVLEKAGFTDVELFAPHAEPNGDFPNVPDHVSNPENPATFDSIIRRAQEVGADLILSTDPDADRLGCAAPLTAGGAWATLTGNQIGALLAESLFEGRRQAGGLREGQYIVKTLVTTEMVRRIADAYGVKTYGDLLVGFKWIGGLVDEVGPEGFLLGVEESHGYLAGTYARDKDAAVAALLLAELAARTKAEGRTLHEKLDALFWQFGCHVEKLFTQTMPGAAGMERMQALMRGLRSEPPRTLAGMAVAQTRDYQRGVIRLPGGAERPLEGPTGDLLIFDLEKEGNYAAVRPSGTEPKVKFYLFAYEPAEQIADLEDTKAQLRRRVEAVADELRTLAEAVRVE